MTRVRTVRCDCCGLDQDVYVADGFAPTTTCEACRSHTGMLPEQVVRREAVHAAMFREALADAEDSAFLAHGERDFYRDQLTVTSADRRALGQALVGVHDLHHYHGMRCCCGLEDCAVANVVSAPSVARLIGTYDEELQTLRELRRANPGAVGAVWDEIDVTLVYPGGVTRAAVVGRHRATG
jgi:hypothetical protein